MQSLTWQGSEWAAPNALSLSGLGLIHLWPFTEWSGDRDRVSELPPGPLWSLCRCNRCLLPCEEVLPIRAPLYSLLQCSFFPDAHTASQVLPRSSVKSLGDAHIFRQPNAKAILFLMNSEITLIPPVLYPCCMFGENKAIQAHVH